MSTPPHDDSWLSTQQLDEHGQPRTEPTRRSAREARRRSERTGRALLLAAAALALVVLALAGLRWRSAHEPVAGAAAPAASAASAGVKSLTSEQLTRSIAQVREQVAKEPNNSSAWAMLAHSQAMLGDFEAARRSYARLAELLPQDAQVLADYADAAAVAQGRRFAGEPAKLIARALAIDPKNLKALMLAGREALDRKQYGEAIALWERARAVSGANPALAQEIEANIAEARAFDGRERPAEAARQPGRATISGQVTLAPDLAAQVSPEDTVFVFARPTKGSRMPVALIRRKVKDLPLAFTLDDSQAMVPDIKLSMLATLAVGARVSRRGDATPHAGDLQGLVEPVDLGARGVQVRIAEVLK